MAPYKLAVLGAFLVGLVFCAFASAAVIAVDEFGNGQGTLGAGFFGPDPGPGGLGGVLTYHLPFAGTAGDVFFGGEPDILFGGDIIRFNGNGTLIFYSDNVGGFDAPADTPGPPDLLQNLAGPIAEVGSEGTNVAFYTPSPGQPGFDSSSPSYVLVSDGVLVPEPSTLLLLGTGIAGLAGAAWRQHRRK